MTKIKIDNFLIEKHHAIGMQITDQHGTRIIEISILQAHRHLNELINAIDNMCSSYNKTIH